MLLFIFRSYCDVIVEYPRSLSSAKYIFVRKSVFFGYELKLLISTAGGRFHFITVQGRHLFEKTTFTVSTLPRALLEPPCASHSGVSRLMGLHYRSSPKTFCYFRMSRRLPFQSTV